MQQTVGGRKIRGVREACVQCSVGTFSAVLKYYSLCCAGLGWDCGPGSTSMVRLKSKRLPSAHGNKREWLAGCMAPAGGGSVTGGALYTHPHPH